VNAQMLHVDRNSDSQTENHDANKKNRPAKDMNHCTLPTFYIQFQNLYYIIFGSCFLISGIVYTLTGPNTVSYMEIAGHLSDILNRTINYNPVSQEEFYRTQVKKRENQSGGRMTLPILRHYKRKSLVTNDVTSC